MAPENTVTPDDTEMRVFEVKFLFAREEARKHGRTFSTKEDQEAAELRFDRLSVQDADYWIRNVYRIQNEMLKHGTGDLRLFYPNSEYKTYFPSKHRHPMRRDFVRRGSRG